MALLVAAGGGKSIVKSILPEDASKWENLEGIAQIVAIVAAFLLLYGNRFRSSNGDVASLLRTLKPSFSQDAFLLLITHVLLGILVLASTNGFPETHSEPFQAMNYPEAVACATPSSVIWGPIMEEVIFRLAIFYVVLHRSGGDVVFAVLLSAGLFGAIHLGNVVTAYRQSKADEELISFEVSGHGNYLESLLENQNISSLLYTMFQVLGGLGVGIVYTLIFTVTGSITTVILLHMANNFTAVITIVRNAALSIVSGQASKMTNLCQPRVSTAVLLVMVISVGVYIATARRCWNKLVSIVRESSLERDSRTIEAESDNKSIEDSVSASTSLTEGLRKRRSEETVDAVEGETPTSTSTPNSGQTPNAVPTPLYFRKIHGLVYGRAA